MDGTAKRSLAFMIALASLVSGCSGIQEYQSKAEAIDASRKWVKDGGEYFFELEPVARWGLVVPLKGWDSLTREEKHLANCNGNNKRLAKELEERELEIQNGFYKRQAYWWRNAFKQDDCEAYAKDKLTEERETYKNKSKDIRYCDTESNQRVCYQLVGVRKGERVPHDASFDSKVKRYFRWWTR